VEFGLFSEDQTNLNGDGANQLLIEEGHIELLHELASHHISFIHSGY
jgi:hypothetical protein